MFKYLLSRDNLAKRVPPFLPRKSQARETMRFERKSDDSWARKARTFNSPRGRNNSSGVTEFSVDW